MVLKVGLPHEGRPVHAVWIESLQEQGSFGLDMQSPLFDAQGNLRLPGEGWVIRPAVLDQDSEESGEIREVGESGGQQRVHSQVELIVSPDGQATIEPTRGRLVFFDREGRAYYNALPGRTSGWFRVATPGQPDAYFLVPHAGDRLAMGQTGDGRVWVWHEDSFTAVMPPESPGDDWKVGSSYRFTGFAGSVSWAEWSDRGYFMARLNDFSSGSRADADDATPPP